MHSQSTTANAPAHRDARAQWVEARHRRGEFATYEELGCALAGGDA